MPLLEELFTSGGYDEKTGLSWDATEEQEKPPRVKPSPFLRKSLPSYHTKNAGPHKYGCLLCLLPSDLEKEIQSLSRAIPQAHLARGGREKQSHITLLYGFINDSLEQIQELRALLTRNGPIKITLGGLSLFEGNEDGDVLKVDIKSPELKKLNREISKSFPCVKTHPVYLPHLTVAYLSPLFSKLHVDPSPYFLGREYLLDTCEYSCVSGHKELIDLAPKRFAVSRPMQVQRDGKTLSRRYKSKGEEPVSEDAPAPVPSTKPVQPITQTPPETPQPETLTSEPPPQSPEPRKPKQSQVEPSKAPTLSQGEKPEAPKVEKPKKGDEGWDVPEVGDELYSNVTKSSVPVVDFGSWSEMKQKYPEAAKEALANLTEGVTEDKLGRTWVLQDSEGNHWLVGKMAMRFFFRRVASPKQETTKGKQKETKKESAEFTLPSTQAQIEAYENGYLLHAVKKRELLDSIRENGLGMAWFSSTEKDAGDQPGEVVLAIHRSQIPETDQYGDPSISPHSGYYINDPDLGDPNIPASKLLIFKGDKLVPLLEVSQELEEVDDSGKKSLHSSCPVCGSRTKRFSGGWRCGSPPCEWSINGAGGDGFGVVEKALPGPDDVPVEEQKPETQPQQKPVSRQEDSPEIKPTKPKKQEESTQETEQTKPETSTQETEVTKPKSPQTTPSKAPTLSSKEKPETISTKPPEPQAPVEQSPSRKYGELPSEVKKNIDEDGILSPVSGIYKQVMEQRGVEKESLDEMLRLFDRHRWGGEFQGEADKEIAEAFHDNTPLGYALRSQSELEEQIFAYYQQTNAARVAAAREKSKNEMKEAWEIGWGPKNNDAYDSWEEQWEVEEAYKFDRALEPLLFYRKGGMDKDILPTSLNSEGAQSHSVSGSTSVQPHYVPDHKWTAEELHKAGYRILGGFGNFQLGYSGEAEITWIKVKSNKTKHGRWVKSDSRVAADYFPPPAEDGSVPNLLPPPDPEFQHQLDKFRYKLGPRQLRAAREEEVDPINIYSDQEDVTIHGVQEWIDKGGPAKHERTEYAQLYGIKVGDKVVINDGNHAICAALILGQKVRMKVMTPDLVGVSLDKALSHLDNSSGGALVGNPQYLFVYGTLRRGHQYHDWLKGESLVGEAHTEPLYSLSEQGSYPALQENPFGGASVRGEVYKVDPQRIREPEQFEENYSLLPVKVQGFQEPVQAFFWRGNGTAKKAFTGEKEDESGRRVCFREGQRIPCEQEQSQQEPPQEGQELEAPADQPLSPEVDQQLERKASSRIKQIIQAVSSLPSKAIPQSVKNVVKKLKDKLIGGLSRRYGEKAAKLILKAAALSAPVPVPGSQPITIAVSLLIAEAYRSYSKLGSPALAKSLEGGMTAQEVVQAAEEWLSWVIGHLKRELEGREGQKALPEQSGKQETINPTPAPSTKADQPEDATTYQESTPTQETEQPQQPSPLPPSKAPTLAAGKVEPPKLQEAASPAPEQTPPTQAVKPPAPSSKLAKAPAQPEPPKTPPAPKLITDVRQSQAYLHYLEQRTTANRSRVEDRYLSDLFKENGFAAKPTVVERKKLDKLVKKGHLELWRGAPEIYQEQLKTGDLFAGLGVYGAGIYAAYGKTGLGVGHHYAQSTGKIIRMALSGDSKVAKYYELEEEMYSTRELYKREHANDPLVKKIEEVRETLLDALKRSDQNLFAETEMELAKLQRRNTNELDLLFGNVSRYAASKGYDAVKVPGLDYMVVLNRSKLAIQDKYVS